MSIIKKIILIGSMFFFVHSAHAFSPKMCFGVPVKWDDNTVNMRVSTVSFPEQSPWRAAIELAIARFNLNPSNLRFTLQSDTNGVAIRNGSNEIWATTPAHVPQLAGLAAGVPEVLDCYYNPFTFELTARVAEGDILFNAEYPFAPTEVKNTLRDYGGTGDSITMIAMHELGHVIGLDHSSQLKYGLMHELSKSMYTNGNSARAYLGEDTSAATTFLYGISSSSRRDVSVTHWKSNGVSITHRKTRLFSTDGSNLGSNYDSMNDERVFQVRPGQTVQAEFTYENNGAQNEPVVDVDFYLSTNNLITKNDLFIRGTWINLSANSDPYTTTHLVTIPFNLTPGKYWLGVIVNGDDAIEETAPYGNNASYRAIKVICTTDTCIKPKPPDPCDFFCP